MHDPHSLRNISMQILYAMYVFEDLIVQTVFITLIKEINHFFFMIEMYVFKIFVASHETAHYKFLKWQYNNAQVCVYLIPK